MSRIIEEQSVEVGDLFRDNDPRLNGKRIIKIISVSHEYAIAEVVEHWNEKLIGRQSYISIDRLQKGKHRMTGYTKISH